jgi:hypothetical protein
VIAALWLPTSTVMPAHAGASRWYLQVRWTTHLWQPEQLVALLPAAGLQLTAELRMPANGEGRAGVLLSAGPSVPAGT